MEEVNKIMEVYRSVVIKHSYYIVALCVAAIGFSVTQTMGVPISKSLIPLGFAVLFFAFSILSGFGLINSMRKGLTLELILKKIQHGQHDVAGNNPVLQQEIYEANSINIPKVSNAATMYSDLQIWLFCLGVLSFLVWRVNEMYLLSL